MAFSPNPATRRRLALYWGVVSHPLELLRDSDQMVDRATMFLVAKGLASPGDKLVTIFGAPVGVPGTTNTIRVKVIE
jgi:pyruvate kinase